MPSLPGNDYKALICIYLGGGNDSMNMLIPTGTDGFNSHATYAATRQFLAIPNQDLGAPKLRQRHLSSGSGNAYYNKGKRDLAYTAGLTQLVKMLAYMV